MVQRGGVFLRLSAKEQPGGDAPFTMKLYLIRHATAVESAQAGEEEPQLSEKGRSRMVHTVAGLKRLNTQPELILTSPLKCAVETAAIVAEGLGNIRVETLAELAPGAELNALIAAVRTHLAMNELALVGHQPGLGHLASFLLTGAQNACDVALRKGGVALLSGDFAEPTARFTLDWLLPPKILRRL